jgi:hypothetical protein
MTKEQLVAAFAESVIGQNAARDSRTGNKFARRYIEAFHQLVELHGDEGREALTVLFGHSDPSVRCMAAAFLIRFCTARASEVLEQLASGSGLAAFAAQCTLKNWANGDWELDPATP